RRRGGEIGGIRASRDSQPPVTIAAFTLLMIGIERSLKVVVLSGSVIFSCAGAISAEWKGALTFNIIARFAPRALHSSTARSTASLWPAMTICDGVLKFAGAQIWPCAAASQ